jgi:hypothetical protein
MTIVATVKTIVYEVAKGIPDAEVIAPLPVWDNQYGSMGVQIKVPQDRGGQKCEIVANFVLSKAELTSEARIRIKSGLAVQAIIADVQIAIRPVRPPMTREMAEEMTRRAV